MTLWRVAKSLLILHDQLKNETRAAPPATSVNEWGTIGDQIHRVENSDHNPTNFPGWGSQIVTAADFPDRPDLGLDARSVLDSIRVSRDARVKYGISHGQMFSSYSVPGYAAWTWRPYSGSDRHFTHGHLSVVGDNRADGIQPWATGLAKVDMSINDVTKADAAFNLAKTVKLDTNGDGRVDTDFPVPVTKRIEAIEAKLKTLDDVNTQLKMINDTLAKLLQDVATLSPSGTIDITGGVLTFVPHVAP